MNVPGAFRSNQSTIQGSKRHVKYVGTRCLTIVVSAIICVIFFVSPAPAGFGDFIKEVGNTVGSAVQTVTKPVTDEIDRAYRRHVRDDYLKAKTKFEDALPSAVRDEFRRTIGPVMHAQKTLLWDVPLNRTDLGDGLLSSYVDYKRAISNNLVIPELIALYHLLKSQSDPFPQWVKEQLAPHWTACGQGEELVIDRTRFVVSSNIVSMLTMGGDKDAITFYDVIVFREPIRDTAEGISLVGHELVHAAQFSHLGIGRFVADYYGGSIFNGGKLDSHRFETAGYNCQSCLSDRYPGPAGTDQVASGSFGGFATASYSPFLTAIQGAPTAQVEQSALSGPYLARAIENQDEEEMERITAWTLSSPRSTREQKAMTARIIAVNGQTVANRTDFEWAHMAVSLNPNDTANWYVLASIAESEGNGEFAAKTILTAARRLFYKQGVAVGTPAYRQRLAQINVMLDYAADVAESGTVEAIACLEKALFMNVRESPVTLDQSVAAARRAIEATTGLGCARYHAEALSVYADYRTRQAQRDLDKNALMDALGATNTAIQMASSCQSSLWSQGLQVNPYLNYQHQRGMALQGMLSSPW